MLAAKLHLLYAYPQVASFLFSMRQTGLAQLMGLPTGAAASTTRTSKRARSANNNNKKTPQCKQEADTPTKRIKVPEAETEGLTTKPVHGIAQLLRLVGSTGTTEKQQDPAAEPTLKAGNAEASQQSTTSAMRAARMAFRRSTQPTQGKRAARTEKVPQEIADKLKNNPKAADDFFKLWLNSRCSWALVEITEEIINREATCHRSKKRWMNAVQLLEHFKLESVVQSIIIAKGSDANTWRPNVDAPGCVEGREYLVTVLEEIDQELSFLKTKATTLHAELDRQAAESMLEGRLRPAWMDTLGINTCSSSAQPTNTTGNGTDDKQVEKNKRMEILKQERERKANEARVAKEQHKNSPAGKAMVWMKGLTKDIHTLTSTIWNIQNTTKVHESIAKEYCLVFTNHKEKLVSLLAGMDRIYKGQQDDAIDTVQACVEAAHDDLKKFKKLEKMFSK